MYSDAALTRFDSELDAATSGRYVADADGIARSPGASSPVCVSFNGSPERSSVVGGVSLSGRASLFSAFSYAQFQQLTVSSNITQANPTGSGAASESMLPAVGTTWTYSGPPLAPTFLSIKAGAPQAITGASLNVTVTRGGSAAAPNTLAGSLALTTAAGVVNATVTGEAILSGGAWHLRGQVRLTGGPTAATAGSGGFRADIVLGNPGTADDTVSWNLDAIVS